MLVEKTDVLLSQDMDDDMADRRMVYISGNTPTIVCMNCASWAQIRHCGRHVVASWLCFELRETEPHYIHQTFSTYPRVNLV